MLNFLISPFWLLSLLPLCSAVPQRGRQRCTAVDTCWPSIDIWNEFNSSIAGRLIATRPSAAVCHAEDYDEVACSTAKQNWTVSDWRTEQPGAYTGMLWEYGPVAQCFINTTREAACQQGYVPRYSVNASSIDDIQQAIHFADEHDLLLAIKNTGHDHLGRSSGGDGLSIWTHHLKGMEWHDDFMPTNGPGNAQGYPAVTLQAGEQWIDVYGAAAKQQRIVVGGHARTVGAAGGWLTGGGHSAWSSKYGLGIDNVLEIEVVSAQGKHLILNEHTNPDYFWAIRGGGGCAWGVVTSVTYKTFPEPNHIQAVFVQVNTTGEAAFRRGLAGTLKGVDLMTAAGYTGYAYIQRPADATPEVPAGFGGFFNQADGNNETFATGTSAFMALNEIEGVSAFALPLQYPSWSVYTDLWLQDPNVAQNVIDASRLLTPAVVHDGAKLGALVDMMVDYGAGFNFIGRVKNDTRADTAVHPAWAESLGILSFGANWEDEATLEEKRQKKHMVVEQSKQLDEIFGSSGGTYINEANPFEPEWQRVFWGTRYEKLLKIKRKVDPTNLFVCNRCVGTDVVFEP
ncbi:hypothetical protein LTR70_007560 [Exophiala xenobiotica]|uniref:FAD-binding PCMH-type domain-containing protein n=1 Tax=Lithohypha guttulata TaxID=1690604 RepID=A0ABR0K7D7_9EURO|nr:hypothetical protein LTR24_005973 [Lithohypha guttulata]KAK5313576.1 hypothetical protein LTR70_007560 [Exophiala xenobiotica]